MPRKEEVLRIREAQYSRATLELAKRFKTGVVQRRVTPACRTSMVAGMYDILGRDRIVQRRIPARFVPLARKDRARPASRRHSSGCTAS
jgi:hypothetical protein